MMKCLNKYVTSLLVALFLLACLAAAPQPDSHQDTQKPDSDTAIIYAVDVAPGNSAADTSDTVDQSSSAPDKSVKPSDRAPAPTNMVSPNTARPDTVNKPDKNSKQTSSQQVMQRLLHYRPPAPVIKPQSKQPSGKQIKVQEKINAMILGIAPGEPMPRLLPEGAFVVSRSGRMTKSPDGFHDIFHFEADSHPSKELPMILLPSEKLGRMENIVKNASKPMVFIISGQVHIYHGANYLMLTTVKVKINRGNLGLSGY